MCISAPKVKAPPPAAERQPMQNPKDQFNSPGGLSAKRRRGLWASIFTSPQGVAGAPAVTGTSGGITGG